MTDSKLLNPKSIPDIVAVTGYMALIVLAVVVTWTSLAAVAEQHASVSAAETMLAQLEGRSLFSGRTDLGRMMSGAPTGSAFLEGQDLNLAGAALLQRVASAVRDVGGSVLSSQVVLDNVRAKDGWVGLVVSCELQEASLQKLLYNIEAGMPFLYIDQLTAEGAKAGVAGDRMRILMGLSGQWWNGK